MKYYIVYSEQNPRGIWVMDCDLAETIENNFAGHKSIGHTEITEEHYNNLIYGTHL